MLEVKEATESINYYMSISQNGLHILQSVGLVRTPTIEVSFSCSSEIISVTYLFQVFHSIVEYNSFCIDAIDRRLTTMLPTSGYVICPGLANYPDNLHIDIKGVKKWAYPFQKRIDSISCHLFHLPNNSKVHPLHTLYNMCEPCKKLQNCIFKWEQHAQDHVLKNLMPSSNFPITKLSPVSQKIRVQNIMKEKSLLL